VRLYLSSFRMGDHPEHLLALAGQDSRAMVIANDPAAVTRAYGAPPVWDGLALLTEAFVPHYRSPGHPETAAIERVVARYRADGIPYRTLRDGQALLINGPQTMIV